MSSLRSISTTICKLMKEVQSMHLPKVSELVIGKCGIRSRTSDSNGYFIKPLPHQVMRGKSKYSLKKERFELTFA